jgi:hypothetical protein
MNGLIMGTLGRTGEPTPTNGAVREKLSAALDDAEAARRGGDEDAVAYAGFVLDKAIEESRAARTGDDQARDDQGQFVGSFDGGVQRRPFKPSAGLEMASSTALMQQAMTARRVERLERDRDEQTLIANV